MDRSSQCGRDAAEASTAMDFLGKLGRLDFDGAFALLDENAVADLPFAGAGMTVRGRAEIDRFLRNSMGRRVDHIEYRLDAAYPSIDGDAVVLEISTEGTSRSGGAFTNRLVAIFRFQNGRIVLFREYFNPLAGA